MAGVTGDMRRVEIVGPLDDAIATVWRELLVRRGSSRDDGEQHDLLVTIEGLERAFPDATNAEASRLGLKRA